LSEETIVSFSKKLLVKLLAIVIIVTAIGITFLIVQAVKSEEKALIDEKTRANQMMAEPILHAIYKDMLDMRAEMARYLVDGTKEVRGIERVQLIRGNGREEAFKDFKTLDEVKKRIGSLKPEWTANHPDVKSNVAKGIDNPKFKEFMFTAKDAKVGISYVEEEGGKKLLTTLVPVLHRPECMACHVSDDARGVLMISTSLDDMYDQLATNRLKWFLIGLLTIGGVSLILGIVVNTVVSTPIKHTSEMLRTISEGTANLTRRLHVTTEDEVGQLSRWFNKFVDGLQGLIKNVASAVDELVGATKGIREAVGGLKMASEGQNLAIEESFDAIQEVDASVKHVAERSESIHASAEGASASTLEMSAAISEVSENVQRLASAVGESASSIIQIAATLREVANHVDTLLGETEQVGTAANEIDFTIKEVAGHSREQAVLAERVKEDAFTLGMDAMGKTRKGIEKIKEEVSKAAGVVDKLGQRSVEIGKIVSVINEVADTTNLLALNATILAAQAGEHGKGFAVVANEVKDLSDRTTASTKEISSMIKLVQEEVHIAVKSMESSLERVEEGTRMSREGEDALNKIIKSADNSLAMAKKVERATEEQSRGISMVVESIHRINGMVEGIKKATDEQSRAAEGISSATELMKDITLHVEQSTNEQSKEIKHISGVIAEVASHMESITKSCMDQKICFDKIVRLVETIKKKSKEHTSSIANIDTTIQKLDEHTTVLKGKIDNFVV